MKRLLAHIFNWPLVYRMSNSGDHIRVKRAYRLTIDGSDVWYLWDYWRETIFENGVVGSYSKWAPANVTAERLIPRRVK